MALPKRKVSRARRGNRRAHWKASSPARSLCPKCGEPKMPHRVCPACGYYKGIQVFEEEEE
ncbi:MAG: 50S ribosomal protein L32 [Deltaproteobacteria bacterium]|nr:MAG: 50S ribosomal protein L32 [Deltaproteobacteria bacterium]